MWEGPVTLYHATELDVGLAVEDYDVKLILSRNLDDWLGSGVYFFDNLERAKMWAIMGKSQGWIKRPAVISAVVDLGNCLNMMEADHEAEFREAERILNIIVENAPGAKLPENVKADGGVMTDRLLDYMVFEMVHILRILRSEEEYHTMVSSFSNNKEIFPGSAIRKNHMQVAVRSHQKISKSKLVWQGP